MNRARRVQNAARPRPPDFYEKSWGKSTPRCRVDLVAVLLIFTEPRTIARWLYESWPDLDGPDRWNMERDLAKFRSYLKKWYYVNDDWAVPLNVSDFPENTNQESWFQYLWENETPELILSRSWMDIGLDY